MAVATLVATEARTAAVTMPLEGITIIIPAPPVHPAHLIVAFPGDLHQVEALTVEEAAPLPDHSEVAATNKTEMV